MFEEGRFQERGRCLTQIDTEDIGHPSFALFQEVVLVTAIVYNGLSWIVKNYQIRTSAGKLASVRLAVI